MNTARRLRLTQHKQNWDEVGVGELIAVKANALKQIFLVCCEHEPVRRIKPSLDRRSIIL